MINYEPDMVTVTDIDLLSTVSQDTNLLLSKLPTNCRNISDEVFPGIHVGDNSAAKNTSYLKKLGITHVINTAQGNSSGSVNTNEKYYEAVGIKYRGLELVDTEYVNISKFFKEISSLIEQILNEKGKILVNCQKGMSRSSTIVLAYLMLKQNMTAVNAIIEMKKSRDIRPNYGFLKQIADLDNDLRRKRGLLIIKE